MSVTPNFSWPLIEPTDFVTNLPADFETFADDVDADVYAIKQTADAALPETVIDAKGDLIVGTAADTAARLAVGTNGQVLIADSAETTGLKWGSAGGGFSQIATGTLSGSSVSITSIPSNYRNLQLIIKDIVLSTTDTFTIRTNSISTGYWGVRIRNTAGTAAVAATGTSDLGTNTTIRNTNSDNIFVINIYDYASTDARKLATTQAFIFDGSNDDTTYAGFQKIEETGAISSIQIATGLIFSATFSGGTYTLYGAS